MVPREELELTRAEYKNMYTAEEPREAPFPVHIEQYNINDGPPTVSEVVESLTELRNHRAAGATGISAENLKDWHFGARPEDPEEEPNRNQNLTTIYQIITSLIHKRKLPSLLQS
jgi:hypothetical protein